MKLFKDKKEIIYTLIAIAAVVSSLLFAASTKSGSGTESADAAGTSDYAETAGTADTERTSDQGPIDDLAGISDPDPDSYLAVAGTSNDAGSDDEGTEFSDGSEADRDLAAGDDHTQNSDSGVVISGNNDTPVDFDADAPFSYCSKPVCVITENGNGEGKDSLDFTFQMTNGIPKSDDDKVYLFALSAYQNEDGINDMWPLSSGEKGSEVKITTWYRDSFLFKRFVPALKCDGRYVAIYHGQYISNVESLAENTREYLNIESKKGLLIDAGTLGSEQLESLNVKRAVFNIPLSYIIGETEDEQYPTIEYEFEGKTYYFNGYRCMLFDSLFGYLEQNGYHSTAIILNDWNSKYPEIIHPKSRNRTGSSLYYAFNTEEEDGVKLLEATALFLAQRYSGGEHGMVYDWVIANEINQQRIWNYMDTDDIDYYVDSFEKAFRIFYNAIRSTYGSAKVYFSVDHDWNDNNGYNRAFFNGRDIVYAFNDYAKRGGSYDWSLSIHPYPNPLTRVRFWQGYFDKSENARCVTPMNLSAVTDVLTKDDFLDTSGNVRDIAVTELGFSSRGGEKIQAAAFAYCYYIIEDNEYISSFLLNRQTDDAESLKSGLALGLYNSDHSEKYITDVFRNIDCDAGDDYIEEMLSVIGEESFETALRRAR